MTELPLQKFVVDQQIPGIHDRTGQECGGLAVLICNIIRQTNIHGEKIQLVRGVITHNRMICWCLAASERDVKNLFMHGGRRFEGHITLVQEFIPDPTIEIIHKFGPETAKKPLSQEIPPTIRICS